MIIKGGISKNKCPNKNRGSFIHRRSEMALRAREEDENEPGGIRKKEIEEGS
jgi:hypothetical protein